MVSIVREFRLTCQILLNVPCLCPNLLRQPFNECFRCADCSRLLQNQEHPVFWHCPDILLDLDQSFNMLTNEGVRINQKQAFYPEPPFARRLLCLGLSISRGDATLVTHRPIQIVDLQGLQFFLAVSSHCY